MHDTRKPYSITSSARASGVGGISNPRVRRGATADENGHYSFAVALLAERGARGFDVVHALGPILLYHLGLGIGTRSDEGAKLLKRSSKYHPCV
jgi:hypothetical protein